MKTKDSCGKAGDSAGMSMKTNDLSSITGNVTENK
jgi:hypothetical protein